MSGVDVWYVYLPHWRVTESASKLTCVQDTWLKKNTNYSWDLLAEEKQKVFKGSVVQCQGLELVIAADAPNANFHRKVDVTADEQH